MRNDDWDDYCSRAAAERVLSDAAKLFAGGESKAREIALYRIHEIVCGLINTGIAGWECASAFRLTLIETFGHSESVADSVTDDVRTRAMSLRGRPDAFVAIPKASPSHDAETEPGTPHAKRALTRRQPATSLDQHAQAKLGIPPDQEKAILERVAKAVEAIDPVVLGAGHEYMRTHIESQLGPMLPIIADAIRAMSPGAP